MRTLIALLGWLAAAAPSLASAQELCGPRAALLQHLARQFGEAVVALGVTAAGAGVLELLATPSGSSWTVLVTLPSGTSCIVATGEHWQAVAPPKPGDPAASFIGERARRAGEES